MRRRYAILDEGLAHNVANAVTEHYAENHSFPFSSDATIAQLRDVSNWIKEQRQATSSRNMRSPDVHDLGAIFIALLETQEGTDICRRIIHQDYNL